MMAKGGKVKLKVYGVDIYNDTLQKEYTFFVHATSKIDAKTQVDAKIRKGEYPLNDWKIEFVSDSLGFPSEFDDDEFAKGGAIYKGDKVKIKGSKKSMTVKDIRKGDKGYIEFSGDKGTFLKGDLEKYAKGGNIGGYSIGGL